MNVNHFKRIKTLESQANGDVCKFNFVSLKVKDQYEYKNPNQKMSQLINQVAFAS